MKCEDEVATWQRAPLVAIATSHIATSVVDLGCILAQLFIQKLLLLKPQTL